MKKLNNHLVVIIILITISTTFAQTNPLKDPNICGRPICKGNEKFKYGPDVQQIYKYSVEIQSLFNGTSKNESTLLIECMVKLEFLTPCDGILTISDVKLSEDLIDGELSIYNDEFSNILSEFQLRFSFNDGIISELCPETKENNWVLNFKRGILSMIHNTMKRFDLDHYNDSEDDVRGKCPTTYKVKGTKNTSLIIEKIKDLTKCQSRSKLHSMIQSVPYNFRSQMEDSKNLLKSSSICELSIDHNIYNKITCEDYYILQLFSNGNAGATTHIVQNLLLINEVNKTSINEEMEINRRTSLLFDHIPSKKPTNNDELNTAKNLIKQMCRQSANDVQIEFSDLFTKFIQSLRALSYSSLSTLYGQTTTTCPTGKKHLLDALPYLGNTASVIVMKDLILNGSVLENLFNEWMMSLAFISRPNEEMIEAASQLLQKPFQPTIILAVTTLTHTYCTQHSNCITNEAVNVILQYIENIILNYHLEQQSQNQQYNNQKTNYQIIVALKALSNIGILSENFNQQLYDLIEDNELDISVRIAAIEAFRRYPCDQSRRFFEKLFRNLDIDTEIRIASYLQIMKCPDYLMIRTIKHCLENEEVNQVGSFVWSHLKNLLKSSSPSRIEIQSLLSDFELIKKFSSDVRKFSNNREGSIYFEEYDIGANYDNNVIFSPSSYVPKSAMFNLTVDVFGESINLFEFYGRVDGFEHYLESIFGPKGPLNSKKLKEKIPKMRWDRSIRDNDVLEKEIDNLPNIMENKFVSPKVSLGYKIFGNDLKYLTFDGDDEIKSALKALNPIDYFKKILSGKEINYNKASMFLDSTYVVPSGAGLPLSLSLLGTTSINLKLFGSLDGRNFAKTKELDLKADIRPSISLDLTGTMSVDAFLLNSGIKLKSSMYTSSAVEGNVKIRGSKLISVKFSIPRQTSEIFGIKSELLLIKNKTEHNQSGLLENLVSKSICSWPSVDKTVGLKLCGEYYFMNVTKLNKMPYFILAGPSGMRLFIEKSDPTAKIYLFEYKWIDRNDFSVISLTFDTPGSTLRRIVGANFTINRQSQNLTLLLQSTSGTVLARGKYKNTDDEKYLQIALNINEKKHFDCSLSLIRQHSRHGFTYYPKIYLGVNGERVLELEGTLKLVSKKGISQYDVDLKFQTKRLTSKLFGYISQTQATIATNLKLDYKFIYTKEQRVMLEFSLANRSPKNMVDIRGTASLFSTSYPHFNFDAKFKFQKGAGPIECKFDLNSSPLPPSHPDADLHRLKFEWIFSYKSLPDSTRILNTIASVKRQSTALNLKGQFSYESRSPNTNLYFLVKYANDKEVSITVYWSHPRTTLLQWEGRLNITVPSFTPMILQGKVIEKQPSNYYVEMQGTWFSDHSISFRGFYRDKSTPRSLNHHLKLLLKSPSFNDISTDLQFYRDNEELKLDLKAFQDKHTYFLFFKHNILSTEKINTEIKLKYKLRQYSIISSVFFGDHRHIHVECHIDQIRDIHFALWEYNEDKYKAAGLEVKWDANRDNNQKLVISTNFTKVASFNYKGNLLISYPGRTVLANFDFILQNRYFNTLLRLSWADHQTFAISLEISYENEKQTLLEIQSQIVTPFDNWHKTILSGVYHHKGNMYRINSTILWNRDQHVILDLYEDYFIDGTTFDCKLKSSLTSTLTNIPSLSIILNHSHNISYIDTNLKLMYDPQHIINIISNWKIDKNEQNTNLTGNIIAITPFNGFKRGYLIGKIHLTKTKYIRGFADLDLDHKKFTINLIGHLKKLTNSMLEFNVTTTMDKYKQLMGRFGFLEEQHHIVAEIVYPSGILGFEILLSIENLLNFDCKLSLATPIPFLQRILLIGKLKPDRADFRIGWNSLLLGFNGIWHYVNVIDFEYSYKIYTPIEGFEENGIVAKLIFKDGLDFEVSLKLSQHKIGLIVLGKPKPRILKELGIKRPTAIYGSKQTWIKEKIEEDVNDEGENDDTLKWTGYVEIDAIIYPTILGTLDIDQEGPLYIIQAKLSLPDGDAEINDEFVFIDYMTMRNDLHITTPYDSMKIITSNYNLEIIPSYKYQLGLNLDYQNRTRWIKTRMLARYGLKVEQENDKKIYNITFQAHTPIESFSQLHLLGLFKIEKNIYSANLSVTTNSSHLSVSTKAEINDSQLNSNILLNANTPLVYIPLTNIIFKRDFSQENNLIDLHIYVPELMRKEIRLMVNWFLKTKKNFFIILNLTTSFKSLENIYGGIKMLWNNNNEIEYWNALNLHPLKTELNATLTNNIFRIGTILNLNKDKFPISIIGNIVHIDENNKNIVGTFTLNDKTFDLKGLINYMDNIPIYARIELIPENGEEPLNFEYKLYSKETGYTLIGNIKHSQKFTQFEANATSKDKYNWQFDIEINTSHEQYNKFIIQSNLTSADHGSSISINSITPIPKLENPKLGASVTSCGQKRLGHIYFELTESKGDIIIDWVWIFLENMYIKLNTNYENNEYKSTSNILAFYKNPNQSFKNLVIGGDANIGPNWSGGSNLTLLLPSYQNVDLDIYLKMPQPISDIYNFKGILNYEKNLKNIYYLSKYRTLYTNKNYGSWGTISLNDNVYMGDIALEWSNKSFINYINFKQLDNNNNIIYKLRTPRFIDQETFVANISYIKSNNYHNITCQTYYPEKISVGYAKIDFKEFGNMNGTINVTIPFRNIGYAGAHFTTKTDAYIFKRYIKIFDAGDTAVLDCNCITERSHSVLERFTKGTLIVEIPLTTRHVANIDFSFKEKEQQSEGQTTVHYNGSKVLEGKYNCLSESRAGFDKDTIHVEIKNKLVPIGADYIHSYDYGPNLADVATHNENDNNDDDDNDDDNNDAEDDGGSKGNNFPTVDKKHLHLYHLYNLTKFNISGELNVKTTSTGRDISFKTTHSNRTVKLWTDYNVLNQQFKQHSRIELSPTAWLEYDLDLYNKTMDDIFDTQLAQINIAYPERNFTGIGSYKIGDTSLSTDLSLNWDKNTKVIQGGLDWKRISSNREEVQLLIKHPTFEKDVIFFGEYEYDNKKLFDIQLTINYSLIPEQTVKFGSCVYDNSNLKQFNYTYNLWAIHDATNLNLNTYGGFYWNQNGYSTGHYTDYKRSYLPLQIAEALARVDFIKNEMEIKKKAGHDLTLLWTKFGGEFPIYTFNITTIHEMNNASGEFYINFIEKLINFDYNITTDGSQSLHMYGFIPDARSAAFNIWRDYEDIRVSDVSYYLRLNHSRLITSRLQWRPDLVSDIQSGIRSNLKQFYNDILQTINDTRQYIRSETNDAIHGIWYNAKPLIQNFLDDLKELKVIEDDFDNLKLFLQASYNANEFYIKDIVNITMTLCDELALKSHFESLPVIFSEIWEIMGESGKKLKKSIVWVVEKIKTYYKNLTDFIHNLLDGDPIDHLSELFKKIVERYDDFMKDLHVKFIQYMEELYKKTYSLIVENWHKTLAAIEPTFLKFIHYLETIVWNTSKEFLDFLYIRKNELIESPYFAQFTNFTHDLDRFYRDITGNNRIASIIKYTKIVSNFLKEKYFSMVPFGKELKDIVVEIFTDLNELRTLPSIVYIEEKLNEIYWKIKWFYDYFEMENRIHHIITLIHTKLTEVTQTALQAEDKYREAKTKFIFEPADGIMLLEQKLPMSWHALNETPKFQEIPELKTIYNMQNYLVATHSSFWDFYYDYKPYTELSGWLPPFKAQALLVGMKYYVTFDRKYYNYHGQCSYLLATDYIDRNFSIVVSFDKYQKELIVLINKTTININMFNNSVKIGDGSNDRYGLPAQVGDTYLYSEAEIIIIKSELGFVLECNMKFNVCVFEVSGWYFGKTAGLWGTINNEPFDDFLTSKNYKAKSNELEQFIDSWTLEKCSTRQSNQLIMIQTDKQIDENIKNLCDEFFQSKVSQLTDCFNRNDRSPFYYMCLNSSNEQDACSSAVAYIKVCEFSNTPLRIPDVCVKCHTPNGTIINEGQFIHLENNDLPNTTDIVFIIEAKECNKNLKTIKSFDSVIELINKEFTELNIIDNRFSIVTFGGDGVFDQPRSIVFNNNIFTDFRTIVNYFDSVPIGNGNSDIFGAVTFATKLLFRPAVSKTFILLPCSECKENNMKLDYAILHQLLMESGITLHILMDEEFSVQKSRESKMLFGIDRNLAYTKKDVRNLKGDEALRKQVSLPKSTLGYCTPLALETNGTVFSSKYLEKDKWSNGKIGMVTSNTNIVNGGNAANSVKKFATVFAKRLAKSTNFYLENNCVDCECTAFNSGVSFMECYPCTYPTRANIDYGFDEDEALSLLQPVDGVLDPFEFEQR